MTDQLTLDEVRERIDLDADTGRRMVPWSTCEIRAAGDGAIRFDGLASVFDRWSVPLGGFRERVQRGSFRNVLKPGHDIVFVYNHNPDMPMARTTVAAGPGSMRLKEATRGLDVQAELAPTTVAKDLEILNRTGVVTGMSFHFRGAVRDSWRAGEDGLLERTIHEFSEIPEVGPCVFPAYGDAGGSIRSLDTLDVDLANPSLLDRAVLRETTLKIHRGELTVSNDVRSAIDAACEALDTVTPWMAERALRAVAQEPEMLAVIQGIRASIEVEGDDQNVNRLAPRLRELEAIELSLR